MIQDAILTCVWKPTWVSLIYRTEPTTKKYKTEKLKSKKRICSEVTVNSLGNPCSQSRRRKRRLRWEGFAENEGFKPGVKQWSGDGWWERWLDGTNERNATHRTKKVKVAHTRLPSVGFWSWSRFLAVSLQVTWVINPAVGCHYFPPGLQLPSQPLRGLLPRLLLGEQRHNGCEQFS